MQLTLVRKTKNPNGTFGTLTVNSGYECQTLEDPANKDKGPIPAGEYRVTVDMSNRFKKLMPHVLGGTVDNRGIRIHSGNTCADTLGCILVGVEADSKRLYSSHVAFEHLFAQIQSGQPNVRLTIKETYQ